MHDGSVFIRNEHATTSCTAHRTETMARPLLYLIFPLAASALPNKITSSAIPLRQPLVSPPARALERRADVCYGPENNTGQLCYEFVGSVDAAGRTIVSDAENTITLDDGLTEPLTTTLVEGVTTVIAPSQIIISTTNSNGETVASNAQTTFTVNTEASTASGTGLPDEPSTAATTGTASPGVVSDSVFTNSAAETVVSSSGQGAITIPTGLTAPVTRTFPEGQVTTIQPDDTILESESSPTTTSSGAVGAFIIPVTTPVETPKATDGGYVVPCDFFWFFDLCPSWDDFSIGGWVLPGPPSVHPP